MPVTILAEYDLIICEEEQVRLQASKAHTTKAHTKISVIDDFDTGFVI